MKARMSRTARPVTRVAIWGEASKARMSCSAFITLISTSATVLLLHILCPVQAGVILKCLADGGGQEVDSFFIQGQAINRLEAMNDLVPGGHESGLQGMAGG